MVEKAQVQTAIRLSGPFIARLDKLAEHMSRPGMRVTRTDVLRAAAHRGVDALEAEAKKKRVPNR